MASRGRRGGVPARDDKQRREERAEQQAPAPQGSVLPPPPPVDYGVFMQGLVQAMQMQAHTQAALQAQLEAQERADVWWSSLLRTRFEDRAVDVAWDVFVRLFRAKFVPEHIQDKMEQEFLSLTQGSMTALEYEARFSELSKYAPHIVEDGRRKTKKFVMGLKPSLRTRLVAFDHRMLDEALSAACRQEGEMEQYLAEKKASQKRPAATFQRQDKKKTVYQTPQKSVAVSNSQVPSVRSSGAKKECPHCGKTHGGSECWLVAEFWPKAILASTPGRLGGVSVQTWTPTLILASSDMDANFSDLHAQQSCKLLKQGMATHWGMSPNGSEGVLSP
ncbi:hypothetical protein Taro_002361 [Colocasia esculenta]|uniref:Retrotransposon gag domain-containing protein n=1 Tax=Colocasia esculenta TaxID=4460 RepID=A0A843TKL7_COLES|nr:hypothetical protein [Colocasia esculenta]